MIASICRGSGLFSPRCSPLSRTLSSDTQRTSYIYDGTQYCRTCIRRCRTLQAKTLRNAPFAGPLLFPREMVTQTEQMIKDNLTKQRDEKQDHSSSGYSRPHPYTSSNRGSSSGGSQPFRGRGRGSQGGNRGGPTNFGRPQSNQGLQFSPAVAGAEVAKGVIRATANEGAVVVEAVPSGIPPEVAVVAISLHYKK